MKAIIPCAGFGTRMGMPGDKSKELLIDPRTGQPIIAHALNLCYTYGLEPLIITRKDKRDLIQYCGENGQIPLLVNPEGEWPDTVLASEPWWHDSNILILPDTRFESTTVIQRMKNDLQLGCLSSIALHKVQDSSKWCIVKDYQITEKPNFDEEGYAMGLIAFERYEGMRIFNSLRHRGSPYDLIDCSFQYLAHFKDITRNGKVD